MIEAAGTLVPSKSDILEVTDNSKGLKPVVGDYWAALLISDGGRGARLLPAIEERATDAGWVEQYRCDVVSGIQLGYRRDDFKVDVSVRTLKDPVTAFISIQRVGDGNPWPPEC